jgi:hypothetical protein
LEHPDERVFAEVGKVVIADAKAIMSEARWAVTLLLGHGTWGDEPQASRGSKQVRAAFDEEALKIPIAGERVVKPSVVSSRRFTKRLRGAPCVRYPRRIADERVKSGATHVLPPF